MNHKGTKTRSSTKALFLILILLPLWCFSESQPYNVLLISIDTLRADRLGCYGYAKKTPNIDSFAAKSVLFASAISQVPMTLPSHCTIFTGLYPYEHGVRNNENFVLSGKYETLAEMFRKNGYATGAVVGSFSLDSFFGINQGFDFYEDKIGQGHDPEINRNAERRGDSVWKLGKAWLEKQKGPWFCFLHFFDPHAVYSPPKPFAQNYDGEVAYTDQLIGKVLAFLKSRNWRTTTIVVLLSDHGESLEEHGESDHGVFLYDATMHVPLIISAPGLKPARIKNQVRLVDVAPTIAQLVGLKAQFSGESLVPFFQGNSIDLPAYSESYYANLLMGWAPLHSIRWQNKKWIDAPKPELYDLKDDPRELKNLYSKSTQEKGLQAELARHLKRKDAAQPAAVDPEVQEKLASLGYVTGGATKSIASTFDPKDGIQLWQEIKKGVSLAQKGQFAESADALQRVLQKQPDNVIAQKFLAAALRKQGKHELAIQYLQAALKSPLHLNDTRCGLAEVYLDKKEAAKASAILQQVLKEEPSNLRALKLAAAAASATNKDSEALQFLDRALKFDPTDVNALSQRGRLLSYQQRDAEALQAYHAVAAHRPLQEEEAIQVAAIYLTSKNLTEAERYFRVALKANEKSVSAWKGLGLILASKQQWPGAFEAFVNAGDCENASKMVQKAPGLPPNEIEIFKKRCE